MLSSFYYSITLYILVLNEFISSQKLVGKLDKMAIVNLGRQHQKLSQEFFLEYLYLVGVISYDFVPSIVLKRCTHL